MSEERWVTAAISDDAVVADILLRLKHTLPNPTPLPPPLPPLPPTWGARQPRSKPSTSSPPLSAVDKKFSDTRRSPTTPLSWTSEGGCEESSSLNFHHHHHAPPPPPPSDRFRSKISSASDRPTTSNKRPRRKKTFNELKEEESLLLNERLHLKKELATLRTTLKEQQSINDNLKRIKLDLEQNREPAERSKGQHEILEASSSSVPRQVKTEDASVHLHASSQEPIFVLPDLNMSPDEDCDLGAMS